MSKTKNQPPADAPPPTFREALLVWIKVGLLSFGGPAGQIALMHRELVERRQWISDSRFLRALNFCMLLPGPEAHQLAIYTGWLLHRAWGGIAAGVLFVLPGALLMAAISLVYVYFGKVPLFESIFYGLKPAVIAIVAAAVIRIGRKTLRHPLLWAVAIGAFIAIFFFKIPFPVIILLAGLIGLFTGRSLTSLPFDSTFSGHPLPSPSFAHTFGTSLIGLLVWFAPIVVCGFFLGVSNTLTQEGIFFSKAALITFGGAYAVLPYVAQQAVETHSWLSTAQMMDGLGLAETTPGPLILVLQFVGFLGGWNHPEPFTPLSAALLGAGISTWTTFVPSFVFIFVAAPWIERTQSHPYLAGALTVITSAVVGVMLNLAVWFSWNVLHSKPGVFDLYSLLASVIFFLLLQTRRVDVFPLIALAAVAGVVWRMF